MQHIKSITLIHYANQMLLNSLELFRYHAAAFGIIADVIKRSFPAIAALIRCSHESRVAHLAVYLSTRTGHNYILEWATV